MPIELLTDYIHKNLLGLSDEEASPVDAKEVHEAFLNGSSAHVAHDVTESASEKAVRQAQEVLREIERLHLEEVKVEQASNEQPEPVDEEEGEEDPDAQDKEARSSETQEVSEVVGTQDVSGNQTAAVGPDIQLEHPASGGSESGIVNPAASNPIFTAISSPVEGGLSEFMASKGWYIAAIAAAGGGIAAIASSSGDGSSSGGASSGSHTPDGETVSNVIAGSIVLGPVTDGIRVDAFAEDGTQLGSSAADGNGNYRIDIGSYTGPVLLKVFDTNGSSGNYIDEATAQDTDLTVGLRAVSVISGATTTVNITPLTELAVRETGLTDPAVTQLNQIPVAPGGFEATIETINKGISKLFLGDGSLGIEAQPIDPVIDRNGTDISATANTYGKVLGALSGADSSASIAGAAGVEATIARLAEGVTDLGKGQDTTWADQDQDGVLARDVVERGMGEVNTAPHLDVQDTQFLQQTGIADDASGPTITSTQFEVDENKTIVGTLTSTDPAGGGTWRLVGGLGGDDNGLFQVSEEGVLRFTNPKNFEVDKSSYSIRVEVTDIFGNSSTQGVTVSLNDVNEVPVLEEAIPGQAAIIDQDFTLDITTYIKDKDAGAIVTYAASGLPDGLTIDAQTGIITGRASQTLTEAVTVAVTATDQAGLTLEHSFDLLVVSEPVIASVSASERSVKDGASFVLALLMSEAVDVTDGLGNITLTLDANGTDVNLTFADASLDGKTLNFNGTAPAAIDVDTVTIKEVTLGSATVSGQVTTQPWDTSIVNQTIPDFAIDNTAPTVTIASDKNTVLFGETAIITFQFSEVPDGFDIATDVTVANGTLDNLEQVPGEPTSFTALYTPNADVESVTVGLSINVGAYSDIAGNQNTEQATKTITVDTTNPTVQSINIDLATGNKATVTFTEVLDGLTIEDFVVDGYVISNLVRKGDVDPDNKAWEMDIAQVQDHTGTRTLELREGSYTDVAGNEGGAGNAIPLSVNRPTITGFVNGDQVNPLTLSGKAPAGTDIGVRVFESGSGTPQGSLLSTTADSGGNWSVNRDFSALTDGGYYIQVGASNTIDSIAGMTANFTVDTGADTPVITQQPPALIEQGASVIVEGTMEALSTAVQVVWGDGSVLSKAATLDADAGTWRVEFTATELSGLADGDVTLMVTATDRAGNEASATSQSTTIELENTAPVENAAATILPQTVVVDQPGQTGGTLILDLANLDGGQTAFTDADAGASANGTLTYAAAMVDGTALPGWLEVRSDGKVLVAQEAAPNAEGQFVIRVTATDGAGEKATRDVTINAATQIAVTVKSHDSPADFKEGDIVDVRVVVDDASLEITQGGNAPVLSILVGGQTVADATYDSHAPDLQQGTTVFVFNFTAPAGVSGPVTVQDFKPGGWTITGPGPATLPVQTLLNQQVTNLLVDNDIPTISTTALSVNEGETVVGQVVADGTGSEIQSWSLVADGSSNSFDNNLFTISANGELTLNSPLDFETGDRPYAVNVQVRDNAGNEVMQQIAITLVDVNEAPTANNGVTIGDQVLVLSQAGEPGGTLILDLAAIDAFTDPDNSSTTNGTLQYTAALDGGALPSWLVMDQGGQLRLAAGETPPEEKDYTLVVTATDGGGQFADRTITLKAVTQIAASVPNPGLQHAKSGDFWQQKVVFDGVLEIAQAGNSPQLTIEIGGQSYTLSYSSHIVDQPPVSGQTQFEFAFNVPDTVSGPVTVVSFDPRGWTINGAGNVPIQTQINQQIPNLAIDNMDPEINTTGPFDVNENETAVTTLQGDGTFSPISSWSLGPSGVDNGLFTLDSQTGALSFNAPQNYEAGKTVYSIDVTLTDSENHTTTKGFTINLQDVNEAPVVNQAIAPQSVTTGLEAGFSGKLILDLADFDNDGGVVTDNDTAFTDEDTAGTNGDLTYSLAAAAGDLPSWLMMTSHGKLIVKGGATVQALPETLNLIVTATDNSTGNLFATQNMTLNVVSAPTLTSVVEGVQNLSVRSNLAFQASEAVSLTNQDGTYTITITNESNGGAKTGFRSETTAHTQTITMIVSNSGATKTFSGGSVSVDGTKIIIDPDKDLDLSNNYSISVSENFFKGDASQQGSVAVSEIAFSTVTPGTNAIANAELSVTVNAAGELESSHSWLDVEGIGNPSSGQLAGVQLDASLKDYAFVFKDWNVDQAASGGVSGIGVKEFNVRIVSFGKGDLIYNDNQNNSVQNDILLLAPLEYSGGGGSYISPGQTIVENGSGGFIGFDGLDFSNYNGTHNPETFDFALYEALGYAGDNTFGGNGVPVISA